MIRRLLWAALKPQRVALGVLLDVTLGPEEPMTSEPIYFPTEAP